jgi:hypothetical protein
MEELEPTEDDAVSYVKHQDQEDNKDKYVVFKMLLGSYSNMSTHEVLPCLQTSEGMCGHAGWRCKNCKKMVYQSFRTIVLTQRQLENVIISEFFGSRDKYLKFLISAAKRRVCEEEDSNTFCDLIGDLVEVGAQKVFSEACEAVVSVVRLSDGYVWGEYGNRCL